MAGLVLSAGTPANAVSAPTLVRATTIAGTATEPLVTGDWVATKGVWGLDLDSVAPLGGATTITSAWRSPTFTARAGQVVFASRIAVKQEPLPGPYEYVNEARLCIGRTCYQWMSETNDAVPAWVSPSTLPYQIEFGHGLTVTWRARTMPLRVEWRYRQHQRDGNYARTTLRVAAGAAAKSV
ncbi:MAG TPA: hypothetical protein VNQ77_00385 [Frankiaceae bacterium]|nr:hypothetical protein [Frankiaceae bacterium]